MTALTPAMRARLDEARAHDPRPAVVEMWDEIEQLVEASSDPAGALIAYCEMFAAAGVEAIAEDRAEIERIAADLGAEIIEVDPALKPKRLKDVTTQGWFQSDPTPCLYFPAGQRVGDRLAAARKIAESLVTA